MASVNKELQKPYNSYITLNDPLVRQIAGRPSGTISMADLRGKSYGTVVQFTGLGRGIRIYGYYQDIVGNCNPRRIEGVDASINGFYTSDEAKDYCYLTFDDRDGNKFYGRTILVNNQQKFLLKYGGDPMASRASCRIHSTWLKNVLKAGGTATVIFLK
ncbi:hypothetical protein [Fusobacterium varium]|nr:hypothetical protein [Fusobacterium varium]